MIEQFIDILNSENEDELLAFLKALTQAQRKELVPVIKALVIEINAPAQSNVAATSRIKGTDSQKDLLQKASFICFNRADYDKTPYPIWMLNERKVEKIIDWCVPTWFSEFVNEQASLNIIPDYINYDWIMRLQEKGALIPSKELIAKILVPVIFEQGSDRKWLCVPERLHHRPVTINEHIWYLFNVETNLHFADRYIYFGKEVNKEEQGWNTALIQLSKNGFVARNRLLKETLLASNKNFNKVLSGWFAQLFANLEPTKDELLVLQNELFAVLSATNSKPVNIALLSIKDIVAEKEFRIEEFLGNVPVLLASDTKATANATLHLLEKIGKANEGYRETVASLACQTFIHNDEELQLRAAKLIVDQSAGHKKIIAEALRPYSSSLLVSSKKILGDLLSPERGSAQDVSAIVVDPAQSKNIDQVPLPVIASKDDFIFLASQVFDNNEPWHLEHFVAACVQFRSLLTPADLYVLEPAFQRALNLTSKGLQTGMGRLELLASLFCIDFGNEIMLRFPKETGTIRILFQQFDHHNGEKLESWTVIPHHSSYTEKWGVKPALPGYEPYKKILVAALKKIRQSEEIPLLATPTHAPCWVDARALIDRLTIYTIANIIPDDMDLQVAISRCVLKKDQQAVAYASEKLKGELRDIIIFLLDPDKKPGIPYQYSGAWTTAALAKKQKHLFALGEHSAYAKLITGYIEPLHWEIGADEYITETYDYELKKYVPVTHHRRVFRSPGFYVDKKSGGIRNMFSGLFATKKVDQPLLNDSMSIKTQWLTVEESDIKRLLFLAPNNPEPLLASVLEECLQYSTFFGETEKRITIATAYALYEMLNEPGIVAHVFIGSCMLCADKTAAKIAGETWVKAVSLGKMKNELLGYVIGEHESADFAPLKRFTDLIASSLLRISPPHDKALQGLVENTLLHLPSQPIKNLRRLLEIYSELLAINSSSVVDDSLRDKIQQWSETESTKKVVAALLA